MSERLPCALEHVARRGPPRVLIAFADANRAARLERLLKADLRLRLLGCPGSVRGALRAARGADLVLVDLARTGPDAAALTARLRRVAPETAVLLYGGGPEEERVFAGLQAGAGGCISARLGIGRIVEAIEDVCRGGVVIEPVLSRRFWRRLAGNAPPESRGAAVVLTLEERELLELLARGLTNPEAGRALRLKRRTVRTRLAKLYRKLGAHSHAQAVAKAVRAGLVTL